MALLEQYRDDRDHGGRQGHGDPAGEHRLAYRPFDAVPSESRLGTEQERSAKPEDGKQRKRSRTGTRRLSTLTLRILVVNVMALGVLVAGVFYLDQYRNQLIEREISTLQSEAQIFAAMVSEGAVSEMDDPGAIFLSTQAARQMVRRLSETTPTRVRLFAADGTLLGDSHLLQGGIGVVEIEELEPLDGSSDQNVGGIWAWVTRLPTSLYGADPLPSLPEQGPDTAQRMSDVAFALDGSPVGSAWQDANNEVIITSTAPVQRFKQVLGAVLLIRAGKGIDTAVREVRIALLQIFAFSISVTILLSLYLAGTIERPLRRLVRAADRVRRSTGRDIAIPDLSRRRDEIGDLSVAFREMTWALWSRLDAIEGFAADVAHEIKNPLTSLRSAVETASRVKDPEQQRKLMSIIQEDVTRLDRLITDISNASRLDAELSRINAEELDLGRIVTMLTDMHVSARPEGANDAPQLIAAVPRHQDFVVLGVETRVVQVVQNLIANAVSFSPPGGRIWISLQATGGYVILTVSDEGPGIPAGKLEAIFERFYTERPLAEKFGTHSGLGLSISKQIIEAHQGRIWAENRYEGSAVVGARFIVELPAVPRSKGSAAKGATAIKGQGPHASATDQ